MKQVLLIVLSVLVSASAFAQPTSTNGDGSSNQGSGDAHTAEITTGTGFDYTNAFINATDLCLSKHLEVAKIIKIDTNGNLYHAQVVCSKVGAAKKLVTGVAFDVAGAQKNIEDKCSSWSQETGIKFNQALIETYYQTGNYITAAGSCN